MTSPIATTPLRHALTFAALVLALATSALLPARRAQAGLGEPACVVVGSSAVAEHLLLVGETFEVQLHAVARCSQAEAPLHAVLVLDAGAGGMFTSVRHFARSLFLEDVPGTRLGVAAAFDTHALGCPMSETEAELSRCVKRLQGYHAPTRMAEGIDLGSQLLLAARHQRHGTAAPLELLLVVTSGLEDEDLEDVREAAALAKERGALLITLCVGAEQDCADLRQLASSPAQALELERLAELRGRFDGIRDGLRVPEVLGWELALDLPRGLAFVEGSAKPAPAEVDAEGRVRWRADVLPARSLTYTFRLKALEAGEHRIARELDAVWHDAYGREAEHGFWAAEVLVREPKLQLEPGMDLAPSP